MCLKGGEMLFGEAEGIRIINIFLGLGYAVLVGLSWRTYKPFRRQFTLVHRLVVLSLVLLVVAIFTSLLDHATYLSDLHSGDANVRTSLVNDFGVVLGMVVSPPALMLLCYDRLYRLHYGGFRLRFILPLMCFAAPLIQNAGCAPEYAVQWRILREDLALGRPFLGGSLFVFLMMVSLVTFLSSLFMGYVMLADGGTVRQEPPSSRRKPSDKY